MFRVRDYLERVHRDAASVAGRVSLLLTQETITRRDVLLVCQELEAAIEITDRLRAEAKLPPRGA